MEQPFDPGEQVREAIRQISAPAREAAEQASTRLVEQAMSHTRLAFQQAIEQATLPARMAAQQAIEQMTAPARLAAEQIVQQAAAPAIAAAAGLARQHAMVSMPLIPPEVLAQIAGPTMPVASLAASFRMAQPEWQVAIAGASAALSGAASRMAFQPFLRNEFVPVGSLVAGAAAALRLAEEPIRSDGTAAAAVDGEMNALQYVLRQMVDHLPPEWREYLRTPTGVIAVLGLLVVVYGAILATVNTAHTLTADPPPVVSPTIVVQPAPVTVIPDQREVDNLVDERLRQLGVDGATER